MRTIESRNFLNGVYYLNSSIVFILTGVKDIRAIGIVSPSLLRI